MENTFSFSSVVYLFILVLVLVTLRYSVFIVPQSENWLIERLGRYHRKIEAGLHLLIPIFEVVRHKVSVQEMQQPPDPINAITLDNVTREIVKHLDEASASESSIEVTYRPYLSNDLSGPQMDPPITLVITEVEADVQRVTAKARMADIGNKTFPSRLYTATEFPGLAR